MTQPNFANDQALLRSIMASLAANQGDESTIDLQAYLHVVLKHWRGIIVLTAFAALLALVHTSTLLPQYRAQATLLFEPTPANNYGTVRDASGGGGYASYYRNSQVFKAQQEIMRSRRFAGQLVDHYDLWKHPYFVAQAATGNIEPGWKTELRDWLPDWAVELKKWVPEWLLELTRGDYAPPPERSDKELKALYRNLAMWAVHGGITLEADDEVLLLRLGFVSPDPEFAADMANKVADYYIQYELETRMLEFTEATAWLTSRSQELREKMLLSEQVLQQYRERENLVSLEGGDSIQGRQMEDVFQRLSAARKLQISLATVQKRLNSDARVLSQLAGSPELIKYEGVRNTLDAVIESQKTVDELAIIFGPKHPKMIDAVNKYQRLSDKLESEKQLVSVSVDADLVAAQADVTRLSAGFEELKNQVRSSDRKQFKLNALERSQKTDQELYNLFVTRVKELSIGSSVSSSNVQMIDHALVPGRPYWPNKTIIILAYAAFAFAAGVAIAFLREYMDKTVRIPEEVEEKLGVPLLGSLDQLILPKGREVSAERMFINKNNSLFSESIRTIRTGIMLSGLDDPHKILAITSTLPDEGKTTVSMNVACAIGQLEKVLLIDADMRRAALGPHFGFARNTLGLADVAAGIKDLDECIHRFEEGGIDILPAGTLPPNPQELLSSSRFEEILREAATRYDRVLIDTAPMHLVSDPMLVARWASAVVYVVRAESTDYQMAKERLRALEKVGKPVLGVVLNGVSSRGSTYGRYRGYGKKGYGTGSYGSHPYAGYVEEDEVEARGKGKRNSNRSRK